MVRVTHARLRTWYSNDDASDAAGADASLAWEGTERPGTDGRSDAVRKNHTAFQLTLCTAPGDGITLVVRGEVTGFMPLRSRRNGEHTYIGEGMTRYVLVSHEGLAVEAVGTAEGYGMSEYLDQGLEEAVAVEEQAEAAGAGAASARL
jgi:hypothetical protein